jgi:hypothetical protein
LIGAAESTDIKFGYFLLWIRRIFQYIDTSK